jgi:3-hydroxyisobutyrate dehydrogenase
LGRSDRRRQSLTGAGYKGGVEPLTVWDALKQSVGDTFVCRHDVPSIFAGHYDPSFTLDLCCKDLDLLAGLGQDFAHWH